MLGSDPTLPVLHALSRPLFIARYAILSPYANGNTTENYRGRSQFSQMVVVDLNDFTVEGVSIVDLAATSRQQVTTADSISVFVVLPADR